MRFVTARMSPSSSLDWICQEGFGFIIIIWRVRFQAKVAALFGVDEILVFPRFPAIFCLMTDDEHCRDKFDHSRIDALRRFNPAQRKATTTIINMCRKGANEV